MDLIRATITLRNPRDRSLAALTVNALVDTGALHQVQFGNRGCFTGALVLGDEILLGAVSMEDMDLVVSPATRSVTVNPASPNVPSSTAKKIGPLVYRHSLI